MNLLYFVFTTLLDYKPDLSSKLVESTNKINNISYYTVDDTNIPIVKNINREILYEGLLAIDSIVFLVSINVIKESQIDTFLQNTVLKAKKLLVLNPKFIEYFDDFTTSPKVANNTLKKILQIRNRMFDMDKSQIALSLTRDRLSDLKRRFQSDTMLYEENKDSLYIRMIKALYKSKDGEDGLAVNLSKEKFEFYRENISLSEEQILETKISFNLGGAIFGPSLLHNLCKKMTIYKKRELMKKSIIMFMEPLKVLHENTINKSFMDKKKLILEFLISCLEIKNNIFRRSIDEAFYHRSILINHFIKEVGNDTDLYKTLDRYQEKEIKKLIYIFENMDEEKLKNIIIHNSHAVDLYLSFLCDNKETSEKKLLKIFK